MDAQLHICTDKRADERKAEVGKERVIEYYILYRQQLPEQEGEGERRQQKAEKKKKGWREELLMYSPHIETS